MKLELPELQLEESELRVSLASKLLEEGVVSLGKAAEISGYTERTFSEILRKRGASPINYQDLDLQEERKHA